ncbi:MAG TPA: hypothetical protein VLQ45_12285 [Thermoanaerobaculia bacterium]|nr:hypothetical protein [Thermoanaerobaculia bacterium]
MVRADLIRRLAELDTLTPAACFARLWLYFKESGVTEGENLLRRRKIHPTRLEFLEGYPSPFSRTSQSLASTLGKLDGTATPAEFDAFGLRWLKSLDQVLKDSVFKSFARQETVADDSRIYKVRRRNAFLAEHYEALGKGVTWEAGQSRSLAAYCPFHTLVPDRVVDVRIDVKPASDWGTPFLHSRLQEESSRLKVLLWPLETQIDYASLDILGENPPPEFVSLRDVRNEEDLQRDVGKALETARALEATLLIFPELAIPPAVEAEIRRILGSANHGRDGYPLLTLFGCCHQPAGEDSDINEASLLGPDGQELCRHRKLTSFTSYRRGGSIHAAERLEIGKTLSILESALGNLTPLVCLDVFNPTLHEVLVQSHGNLFVVPSLSPRRPPTARQPAASRQATGPAPSSATAGSRAPRSAASTRSPGKGYRKSRGKTYLLYKLESAG